MLVCVGLVRWSDEKCGSGPAEYISEQLSDADQLISRRSNFQSFNLLIFTVIPYSFNEQRTSVQCASALLVEEYS